MSDLFDKPITCDYKISARLRLNFVAMATVAVLSLLSLAADYSYYFAIAAIALASAYTYSVRCYIFSDTAGSVRRLSLYKNSARLYYANHTSKSLGIKKVCITSEWVVIVFDNGERIIIDQASVSTRHYRAIRRQILSCEPGRLDRI